MCCNLLRSDRQYRLLLVSFGAYNASSVHHLGIGLFETGFSDHIGARGPAKCAVVCHGLVLVFIRVSLTIYRRPAAVNVSTINMAYHSANTTVFSKSDRSRDLKHREDKSLDLSSFPTKNPIFQLSIFNISGSLKFKFVKFCNVHLP